MLDPCFKALHIVKNLVGCGNAVRLAFEYDAKIVILLLMVCFEWFNPNIVATATSKDDVGLEFEENMFGVGPQLKNLFEH
jgi:hypothetical protein